MSPTDAERKLWGFLKAKPLGVKFGRQHPIGPFIADFYAHQIKLAMEVDGNVHAEPETAEKDKLRQASIESEGITVVRFTNDAVLHKFNEVKGHIEIIIEQLLKSRQDPSTMR
jgi:cyclase